MRVMKEELVIELCVCGYHVYKDIWEAVIGKNYCVNEKLGTLRTNTYVCHSCEKC